MQGAVLGTEESGAEWTRPYTHTLSPAARNLGFPDTGGGSVGAIQGSNQAVRTGRMSCSRQGEARSPPYQVQGIRGNSRPLQDGVTVHALGSREQEDLQGMETLRL